MLYFDHNATTPVRPEAVEAVQRALTQAWGNPSSSHQAGQLATETLERARAQVASAVGAEAEHIVTFVSGATEGIGQVVASIAPGRVLVSAVEHVAVHAAVEARDDLVVESIAVDSAGQVLIDPLRRQLRDGTPPSAVMVMAANNETGVIQPIGELVPELKARGIPMVVDATQFIGRLPMHHALPDYLILTGHKLGGPKGVGAIVSHQDAPLAAIIRGGGQEGGRREGTEPLPAIAGFGAAMEIVEAERLSESSRLSRLREGVAKVLLEMCPGSAVLGLGAPRLPNTLSWMVPAPLRAAEVNHALEQRGVCISAGSACHAGSTKPSAVLTAMGLSAEEASRVLRISMGHTTTRDEVNALLNHLIEVIEELSA